MMEEELDNLIEMLEADLEKYRYLDTSDALYIPQDHKFTRILLTLAHAVRDKS